MESLEGVSIDVGLVWFSEEKVQFVEGEVARPLLAGGDILPGWSSKPDSSQIPE